MSMIKPQLLLAILTALIVGFAPSCISVQRIETVEIGSNKYFFSDAMPYSPHLNWFLANQYCRSIGMDLLSMPRREEATDLIDFLQQNGKSTSSYWTSGNQLGSHMWIWMTSGHPFNATFDLWPESGAPITVSQKSCAYLQGGTWYAANCMEDKTFACQLTRCYFFNYAVTNRKDFGQGLTQIRSRKGRPNSSTQTEQETHPSSPFPDNKNAASISIISTLHQKNKDATMLKLSNSTPLTQHLTIPISRPTSEHSPNDSFVRDQLPSSDSLNRDESFPTSFTEQNEINSEPGDSVYQHLVPPAIGLPTLSQSEGNTTRDNQGNLPFLRKHQRKEEFSWAFSRDG